MGTVGVDVIDGDRGSILTTRQGKERVLEDGRISGQELAGTVASDEELISATTQLFDEIHPNSYQIKDFDTMNEVMVGIFARMYHLMITKQKDYGPDNISKAGLRGIITRGDDKLERLKTLVGSPEQQVDAVKAIMEKLPDDATDGEMAEALSDIQHTLFPTTAVKGESIEDTLLDLADYGLIGYMLYMDAWGRPLDS